MFDIYVNGVIPTRLDELDTIRLKVGQTLKIDGEDLELILSSGAGPICIQENVSEAMAIKVRDTLTKLGLICTYKQRKAFRWDELSLESIQKADEVFTCPACDENHPLVDDAEPELCPNCRVHIENYRKKINQEAEYEELRLRMIRSAQSKLETEERDKSIEAERLARQEIEKKLADELGLKPKWSLKSLFSASEGNSKKPLLVALVLVISLAAYYFVSQQNKPHDLPVLQEADLANIPEQAVSAAVVDETSSVVASNSTTVAPDITESAPTANAQTLVVQNGETPAQASLAKAHEDTTKFLNSIGIDTKAPVQQGVVNVVELPDEGDIIGKDAITPASQTVSPTVTAQNQSLQSNVASDVKSAIQNSSLVKHELSSAKNDFVEIMYDNSERDLEWDLFIDKTVKSYIAQGKLKSAYIVSQYQTNINDYVDTMAELLNQFNKLGRQDLLGPSLIKLTQRIETQPIGLQAILKMQLGLKHYNSEEKAKLFNEAEQAASALANPIEQANAYAAMAYYEKAAGDIKNSDRHFLLAETKLKSVPAGFDKFSGYIHLAEYYSRADAVLNVEITMTQADLSLIQSDSKFQSPGNAMLLSVAHLNGNPLLIQKYSSRPIDSVSRVNAVYQSMLMKLKKETLPDFSKQLSALDTADFSGIAMALAAEFEPNAVKQQNLIADAQQKLPSITNNATKAVVASKLARAAQRIGKIDVANGLLEQSLSAAKLTQNNQQMDQVLKLISLDSGRVFLNDIALKAANLIHDETVKASTLDTVKLSQQVSQILTNK